MNMNWPLVAAILAVLAVPFGIAAIQDIGREDPPPAAEDGISVASVGVAAGVAEPPEPVEPDERAHGWQRTHAMDQDFFDRVFLAGGPHPALAGALAGARFGMTRDQLGADAPALWRWAEQDVSEFGPAAVRLDFEERGGEGLTAIAIRFPDDGSARRILTSAWGAPVDAQGQDDEARHFWFDSASGTRVLLREDAASATTEVTLQRVQPIASLYRRGRGFAFERRPILGATAEELAAEHAADFEVDHASPAAAHLMVDATDYALARTRCTIAFHDGKAVALQVVVDHSGRADFGPLAFAALREQLGPVRRARSEGDDNRWTFDDGVTLQQLAESSQLVISASRP
jgi:hypothetical protein